MSFTWSTSKLIEPFSNDNETFWHFDRWMEPSIIYINEKTFTSLPSTNDDGEHYVQQWKVVRLNCAPHSKLTGHQIECDTDLIIKFSFFCGKHHVISSVFFFHFCLLTVNLHFDCIYVYLYLFYSTRLSNHITCNVYQMFQFI